MTRNRRPWIFGILIWLLLLGSIWLGLNGRFPWLDTAWAFRRTFLFAVPSVLIKARFVEGISYRRLTVCKTPAQREQAG